MKKLLSIIILLSFIQNIQGQIAFCPVGSEWHYSFYYWLNNSSQNEKIKYVRDSIVNNESVKVLSHNIYYNQYCVPFSSNVLSLIKQKGDTIFNRSAATQHTWQILYNFAALQGQSWTGTVTTFFNTQTITYTVTVDSVDYVTINNFTLKNLYVRYQYSGTAFVDVVRITERLGCNKYMFNYMSPNSCGESINLSNFLCYADAEFGLKQFTNFQCDYSNPAGFQENDYSNTTIKIYPNPAASFVQVSPEKQLTDSKYILSIKDVTGREIKQVVISDLNSSSNKIELSDLAQGVYILSLTNNNGLVFTGKLIKSE